MADPQAGAPSIEDRVAAFMNGEPKPQPQAEAASPPAEEAPVIAEEQPIEAEVPAESPFEFDLTHNGQPVKVTDKSQLKDYAEKGFDYTRKAMALADERRAVEQEKALVRQRAQLQPQVLEAVADVKAYERQIKGYEKVDWVSLAQQMEPQQFLRERAAYDQLQEGYHKAREHADLTLRHFRDIEQQAEGQYLQSELSKAVNAVPDWRDQTKFNQAKQTFSAYLSEMGFTPEEISGVRDHRHLLILRDAAAYRALQKSRAVSNAKVADKSPVATPGTSLQTRAERHRTQQEELGRQIKSTKNERVKEQLIAQKIFGSGFK